MKQKDIPYGFRVEVNVRKGLLTRDKLGPMWSEFSAPTLSITSRCVSRADAERVYEKLKLCLSAALR